MNDLIIDLQKDLDIEVIRLVAHPEDSGDYIGVLIKNSVSGKGHLYDRQGLEELASALQDLANQLPL